ncbi:uncharacterized protein Dana_GF11010, isoform T [Drosophila ananassae]|uniref:Uncharacterized protein, isoform T n=1 Tax=Drosophila ananassae TaxID=7217 RepID=A0A0P8ZWP0_DROAN|nr:uncharacterized protein Dana_GF11010, isoform T [Drosophila ananassae]
MTCKYLLSTSIMSPRPIWSWCPPMNILRKNHLLKLSGLCDLIPFFVIFFLAQPCLTEAQIDSTVSEQETKSVTLPCPVNEGKCGKLHSLNWFKGEDRIAAMLLGETNVTNVNKEYKNRVTVELNPYRLIINDLKIGDEDIYLCDTTFFIPEETCDNFNGYRIELRVLVPPSEVIILDVKGDRIENGSVVGPMQERQSLKAACTVKNTRPQPDVGWFRGSKRLTTLRPTSIEMNGVEHHTVQGSKVILTCDIHGARPPVNLTWYNITSPIATEENIVTEIRTRAFEKNDGTYHTQSELIFNATRFENDRVFRCEAENIVIQINREKPISSALTLEVLYPPVVKVSPPEVVTNTSEIVLLNCEYVANPASLTNVVWYRNNEVVNVNNTDRYQGGNSENVALVIKSTEKDDTGNYSCQLSNSIGKGTSEQEINLDVQYVPTVEVVMIPEGPVKESDESNVTLFCNILDANPSILTKVRWYANSTLLKELPDCEETNEDLCHIDPSKLLLESIGRGFFYNYSCEGLNSAGWGPRSEDKELIVHYEPGPATLSNFPLIAVKKKSVVFTCSVEDPGYPDTNRYRWLRGGRGPLQDIVTKDWTVEPVGLDSRTNYSCYAYNEGGKGIMATVNLKVHAPPFFIKNLPPYTGILHSSPSANLTCRIECVPRCEISWLKDGIPIEKNNTKYFVKEKYMDPSPATGDFESMLSVLHFNMSNWIQKKFDIEADNDNYTCLSTSNSVGPSVKSTTYFSIEYSPINTTVSEENVYVEEGTIPARILCKARANPEPSYKWIFKNETIANGNTLIFDSGLHRNENGIYTCMAYNKHGNNTANSIINVQFKPDCAIKRENIDGQDTLICTAFGNPLEADLTWSIKGENETIENLGSGYRNDLSDKSFYVLKADYGITRTFRCVANNTVGSGTFCEIEVDVRPKKQLAWWQQWKINNIVLLLTGILILLLIVVIICCIIICVCRRRRRQDKLHDKSSSMGEPLTEPCEYENLPFHGLQTAPNKSYNTPKSFNNNVNVIHGGLRSKKLNEDYNKAIDGDPQVVLHNSLDKKILLRQPIKHPMFSMEYLSSKVPHQEKSSNRLNNSQKANLTLQTCFPKINPNTKKNPYHLELDNTLDVITQKLNKKSTKHDLSFGNAHDNHPTDVEKESLEISISGSNRFYAANTVHKYNKGMQNIQEKTMEKEFQLLKSAEETNFKTKHFVNSTACLTTSPSVEGLCISPRCQQQYPFMNNRNGNSDTHCGFLDENRSKNSDECVRSIGRECKSKKYLATAQMHSFSTKETQKKIHRNLNHKIKRCAVETDTNLQSIEQARYRINRSDSGISNSSQESQMPTLSPLGRSKYTKIKLVNSPSIYNNKKIVHKLECGKNDQQNCFIEMDSSCFGNIGLDSISSPVKNNSKSFSIFALKQSDGSSKKVVRLDKQFQQKINTDHSATPIIQCLERTKIVHPIDQSNCKISENLLESRQRKNSIPDQYELLQLRKIIGNNDVCVRKKFKRKYRRLTISDPYTLTQLRKLKASSNKFRNTDNSLINISSKFNKITKKDYCKSKLPLGRLQRNITSPFLFIDNLQSIPTISITNDIEDQNRDGTYDCMVVRRPIRLPLRKHHTFHFQNVETANGKLQELRKKLYHNRQKMIEKHVHGPLINLPMTLNESNGFMPISPTQAEATETHISQQKN